MLLIISKVLVVFIYVAIGFAANRFKVLPDESTKYLINLIMEITVPCLMISSITGQELDSNMYRNTILTLVISVGVYVVIMILSSLFTDRAFKGMPQQDRNVLASAMTGCNSGFMGYPVSKAVFGSTVFYFVVIQTVANNIYLFCMSMMHLNHRLVRTGEKRDWKEIIKPFTSLASIATIVAVIMLFAGIRPPEYAMEILTTVGDVTIPVSMILVGVQLGGSDFGILFSNKALIVTSIMKLVAAPAIALLVVMPLPVDPVVKLTVVLCTSFPSAVVGVAVSAREHSNSQLMAEAVAASTVMSVITLPVWILICGKLFI